MWSLLCSPSVYPSRNCRKLAITGQSHRTSLLLASALIGRNSLPITRPFTSDLEATLTGVPILLSPATSRKETRIAIHAAADLSSNFPTAIASTTFDVADDMEWNAILRREYATFLQAHQQQLLASSPGGEKVVKIDLSFDETFPSSLEVLILPPATPQSRQTLALLSTTCSPIILYAHQHELFSPFVDDVTDAALVEGFGTLWRQDAFFVDVGKRMTDLGLMESSVAVLSDQNIMNLFREEVNSTCSGLNLSQPVHNLAKFSNQFYAFNPLEALAGREEAKCARSTLLQMIQLHVNAQYKSRELAFLTNSIPDIDERTTDAFDSFKTALSFPTMNPDPLTQASSFVALNRGDFENIAAHVDCGFLDNQSVKHSDIRRVVVPLMVDGALDAIAVIRRQQLVRNLQAVIQTPITQAIRSKPDSVALVRRFINLGRSRVGPTALRYTSQDDVVHQLTELVTAILVRPLIEPTDGIAQARRARLIEFGVTLYPDPGFFSFSSTLLVNHPFKVAFVERLYNELQTILGLENTHTCFLAGLHALLRELTQARVAEQDLLESSRLLLRSLQPQPSTRPSKNQAEEQAHGEDRSKIRKSQQAIELDRHEND